MGNLHRSSFTDDFHNYDSIRIVQVTQILWEGNFTCDCFSRLYLHSYGGHTKFKAEFLIVFLSQMQPLDCFWGTHKSLLSSRWEWECSQQLDTILLAVICRTFSHFSNPLILIPIFVERRSWIIWLQLTINNRSKVSFTHLEMWLLEQRTKTSVQSVKWLWLNSQTKANSASLLSGCGRVTFSA